MFKSKEINVIVHYPETEEGKIALRERIGEAWVYAVEGYIMRLPIPNSEKVALFDRVLKKLYERYGTDS
ncbi:MAG: hypothetical protein GX065_02205 [Firmicutes bacterium]|nr:hypothetical protein [Bacillota bacterium]